MNMLCQSAVRSKFQFVDGHACLPKQTLQSAVQSCDKKHLTWGRYFTTIYGTQEDEGGISSELMDQGGPETIA